jgi:transglutaminase-like putative cysteine protease
MRQFHQPKSSVNRSFVRRGRLHFRKHPSNSKSVGINFYVLGVSKKFATSPHITFGYQDARSTRTALEAYEEGIGVCRDYAHLAIAFCRCMNIPARYINGHLGDIGVPILDPMDFSAWIEVYLGGRWMTFDPRNNIPRIGRIVVAHGRDAADVPLIISFGPHLLKSFRIWTYDIAE